MDDFFIFALLITARAIQIIETDKLNYSPKIKFQVYHKLIEKTLYASL